MNDMKLYLSSYKLGDKAQEFAEMFRNKKVALISNALDFSTDLVRKEKSRKNDEVELQSIGLEPEELDLRLYFGKRQQLREKMKEFGGVWVRGGNTFLLRKAFAQSGFDSLLHECIPTEFVYGGFSAGACVLSPTLEGIDLADDPQAQSEGYSPQVIWDGVGLIPYSIAPHYQSNHPESSLIEKSVKYFQDHGVPFKTLRDGEVIIEEL